MQLIILESEFVPWYHISSGMRKVEHYAKEMFKFVLGHKISVYFIDQNDRWSAAYDRFTNTLYFNINVNLGLGRRWFNGDINDEKVGLLIHEAAHEYEYDEPSKDYEYYLAMVGARMRNFRYSKEKK